MLAAPRSSGVGSRASSRVRCAGSSRPRRRSGRATSTARAPRARGPPEVRSLARVFNETVAKLERLVRSQEEFVADASHELRTPLTALRLRLENLGERRPDAALREVERLSELVDGLLALARADAGAAPARAGRRGRVRARPRRDLAAARRRAGRRGSPSRSSGPLPVRAGPQRLAQVLDNLVANALDARRRRGSTVTISAHGRAAVGRAARRDEGPGMTAGGARARVRPLLARRLGRGRLRARPRDRPEARRGRRRRGRAAPRRPAAASTPSCGSVALPEPLPKPWPDASPALGPRGRRTAA